MLKYNNDDVIDVGYDMCMHAAFHKALFKTDW